MRNKSMKVEVDHANYERRVVTHGDLGTALRLAADDSAGYKRYVKSVQVCCDILGIWSVELYVYRALPVANEIIYAQAEDAA